MPRYRIHYLRESQRQRFRQTLPSNPPLQLKKKDYEPGGVIEAGSPYAAWKQTREAVVQPRPIDVGDALESESGELLICRYVGFDPAQWLAVEPAPGPAGSETAEGGAPPAATPPAGRDD